MLLEDVQHFNRMHVVIRPVVLAACRSDRRIPISVASNHQDGERRQRVFGARDGDWGIAAIAEIRRACDRNMPALIVSGDTSEIAAAEARVAGLTRLAKPLVAAVLGRAAEAAFDGPPTESRRPSFERKLPGSAEPARELSDLRKGPSLEGADVP